jgi:hypothetical protein
MPEIPEDSMLNIRPNTLINGARYDLMIEGPGGKGFLCEPERPVGRLDEGMNFRREAPRSLRIAPTTGLTEIDCIRPLGQNPSLTRSSLEEIMVVAGLVCHLGQLNLTSVLLTTGASGAANGNR